MNRKKMLCVLTGALAFGVVWAGIASSANTTTSVRRTPNPDYERAVERMSAPDLVFSDVALEMPAEGGTMVLAAANSKTCSQRCSKRCSVGCTTTRGCSSRCKSYTDGCGGTGSSGSSGSSGSTSLSPTRVVPQGSTSTSSVAFSPVTTALTIANVKRALIAEGYHLCVNDLMDTATREAIFEFQRKRRLVPSGVVDAPTEEALRGILEWMARERQ